MLEWYFSKESLPYWCILVLDCFIVFSSTLVVYWVFNRTGETFDNRFAVVYTTAMYTMLSLLGARLFHTYSGVVRYSSFVDLLRVAYANALTMVLALLVSWYAENHGVDSLSALNQTQTVLVFVMSTLLMWGVRVLVKTLHDVTLSNSRAMRVLIYGAMSGGIGLAKYIRSQKPQRFLLRGFISHDKRSHHMLLMGEKVYNVSDDLLSVIRSQRIQAVLISPLRVTEFRDNQELQDLLIGVGCKIFLSQQVKEAKIKDGNMTEEDDFSSVQLQEVSVEDLLPRQEIKVDMEQVGEQLRGRRVLVTGSAGSIGSEIVRQIAVYRPERMILVDQAETPQHDIQLMMDHDYPDVDSEVIVTTICNERHMEDIFRRFRPNYVFHAAAYKHVPMMEDNPSEAVQNNVFGTKLIADLSVKYGVSKFVMVSTDKAVNPTNVMGCSKRICEIYVQSLNALLKKESEEKSSKDNSKGVPCQFVTTRFGNVLGSNGSVIPLFREQIKAGGPVTVTDKRIVRYFMLIPEACKLVLEAGTKGNGGEIFVFDMGKPVRIADLAKRMIMLSGAKNVEIKYTGLRPGEKLYEEVLNELEGTKPSFHEKIRIAQVREYDYHQVNHDIDELIAISQQYDNMATVRKMKDIVPEYISNNSVYEKLDNKSK